MTSYACARALARRLSIIPYMMPLNFTLVDCLFASKQLAYNNAHGRRVYKLSGIRIYLGIDRDLLARLASALARAYDVIEIRVPNKKNLHFGVIGL